MIILIKRTFYFANELRIFTTLSFNLLNTILIFEDQNKIETLAFPKSVTKIYSRPNPLNFSKAFLEVRAIYRKECVNLRKP